MEQLLFVSNFVFILFLQPDLFKPQPTEPQIDIISFGTSNPGDLADSDDIDDPELMAFLGKKSNRNIQFEEPRIVELDARGNAIIPVRPYRIGSPTQFTYSSDEDEDDDERDSGDYLDGSIGGDVVIDMKTDWTARSDSPAESEPGMPIPESTENFDLFKYSVDIPSLTQDFTNLNKIICDEDFAKEINEYYGPEEDPADLDAKDPATGERINRPKEVTDDFEDNGSYSDFDVEEDEEEGDFFNLDIDEIDLEELDDDDELEDMDEFDDSIDAPRKSKKSRGKGGPKKGPNETKADDGTDTTGYKAKSFIYDILRYELLYDCKKFEQSSKTPQVCLNFGLMSCRITRC